MSKYKEGKIERYLVEQVERYGGKAYKWVCPGRRGVPDRIVKFKHVEAVLVEVKAPGERLDPQQIVVHEELDSVGWLTCVVSTKDEVDRVATHLASLDRGTD